MKRITAATIVGLLVVVAVVAALMHKSDNKSSSNQPASSNTSQQSSNQQPANQQSSNTVNIVNMMFTPSQITVKKGQTVTWTNNDSMTHTVTIDNGTGPNSGDVEPGATYSYTFQQSGSYQYHCDIHPSMRGTIVVQ